MILRFSKNDHVSLDVDAVAMDTMAITPPDTKKAKKYEKKFIKSRLALVDALKEFNRELVALRAYKLRLPDQKSNK